MPPNTDVDDDHWFDDRTVENREVLLRRIKQEKIKPHPTIPNQFQASSSEFKTFEMSVYIASKTTPETVLANYPNDSLVAITAEFVRENLKLIVVLDPNHPDPAHRVVGRTDHKRISSGAAYDIKERAEWVVLKPPEQSG